MSALYRILSDSLPTLLLGIPLTYMTYLKQRYWDQTLIFTSPRSFKELAVFPEDQADILLGEASAEVFCSKWSILPYALFMLIFFGVPSFGRPLEKFMAPSGGILAEIVFFVLLLFILGVGFWVVKKLSMRLVRPFLISLIERANNFA